MDGDVSVGDRFRVGTAELVVTQPRIPRFKLGIKIGRDEFVTEFLQRGLLGFYLAVAGEGAVAAGDPIAELERDSRRCQAAAAAVAAGSRERRPAGRSRPSSYERGASVRRAAISFRTSVLGSGRSTGKCSALLVIVYAPSSLASAGSTEPLKGR
jgi:MOSC domain-containing protein YiiM